MAIRERTARAQRAAKPEKRGEKRKLLSSGDLLLVRKDMAELWARRGLRALLMLLPVTLVVLVPIVYFSAISLLPAAPGAQVPQRILSLLPPGAADMEYRLAWQAAFQELLCPLLFLCVPILTAAASASCAFVTERETGTFETLLLTSLDVKAVFNAKVTGCTILSVLISGASFLLFGITLMIAGLFTGAPLLLNLDWLVLVLLLAPVLSLFSVVFVGLILNRVHSTAESLQTMGYLILPVVVLYLVQLTGALRLNALVLAVVALGLAIADVVLFNAASRGFTPERLLREEGDGPSN
ncbi:hypothetical protein AALA61_05155 [Oscillospiraceae bacterium 42-9]